MSKNEIRLTQVYRVNGRLVVAKSIEDAIAIWRGWMEPGAPEIRSVERVGNDSYQAVGDDALISPAESIGTSNEDYYQIIALQSKIEVKDKIIRDLQETASRLTDELEALKTKKQ